MHSVDIKTFALRFSALALPVTGYPTSYIATLLQATIMLLYNKYYVLRTLIIHWFLSHPCIFSSMHFVTLVEVILMS